MDNHWGVELLTRVFMGFGARQLHRVVSIAEANALLAKLQIDLIVSEAVIDGEDVYEFVRNVRLSSEREPNRFVPVILLSAHTAAQKVAQARDAGINFFVAKPISPKVIMDRVLWVANGKRQCLETDTYAGPDRRFRDDPLPPGLAGRRRTDAKTIEPEENTA
ncbi:MAG TPA: response regulator [Caulobacteraceae bacterium]|nr:response regulator [Caulobacteraceae bacterium]